MAYEIKMETNEVAKFRNLILQISQIIKDRIHDMKYLLDTFNQVSLSMNILKEHMYQGISQGNKIVEMLDRMAFDVDRIRTAFINADNEDGSGINLIDTGLMGEKLTKYKSINIITHKDNDESFWNKILNDKTPPLSRLGIGEIPSSNDIANYLISTFATSAFGTVLGNADKIKKSGAKGYISKNNMIHIYPENSLATYSPYTKESKFAGGIGKTLTMNAITLDLENTWSAYSGNTVKKRIEKSGIQIAGDSLAWLGGKGTEALASVGVINLGDGSGEFMIGVAVAGDIVIAKKVNDVEDYFCKKYRIN